MSAPRIVEDLNTALADLLARDPRLYVLGEDITDPYGGAFKVTRGLSTRHPDRVLGTPISESAIVGAGAGLALRGNRVIVELMFGDFIGLCFDQLVNFASKSVSMYGERLGLPLVVRCPVGGRRGYGPTHSQNLAKHFIGVPHLNLFELSAFTPARVTFERMFSLNEPCILFEDKGLYAGHPHRDGIVDEVFRYRPLDPDGHFTHVFADVAATPDCLLIAPGGVAPRAIDAMHDLLMHHDVVTELVVPEQLHPLDLSPVLPLVRAAGRVCVAEDGVAGGTWGREVAGELYDRCWTDLRSPIRSVHPGPVVLPAARHLEDDVAMTSSTIRTSLIELVNG